MEVKDEPLSAYNLTVDNDHTYFIAGNYKVEGVWVHNKCQENIPLIATDTKKTLPGGEKIFIIKDVNANPVKIYQSKVDGKWYATKDYNNPNAQPVKPISTDRTPRKGGTAIPFKEPVQANNGLVYKSNEKHTPGQGGKNGKAPAGIEPTNSLELFDQSKPIGGKRYAFDKNGDIHQYTDANNGTWHWAGSTADTKATLKLTDDVKSQLKKAFPEQSKNKRLE